VDQYCTVHRPTQKDFILPKQVFEVSPNSSHRRAASTPLVGYLVNDMLLQTRPAISGDALDQSSMGDTPNTSFDNMNYLLRRCPIVYCYLIVCARLNWQLLASFPVQIVHRIVSDVNIGL